MSPLDAFSSTLKRLRKNKSWSQENLAYYCGLDRTYISLLERGLRNPTLTTLFSLANSLGYKPHQLVYEIESEMELSNVGDSNEN
ncbi:MAG TPA: XRE family transcriptional regulator [Firmicutes bacterium]|jgi:transcriptional regulator with XRE-family HTH domain|nr:XRE family transcriptional regulator [Bacillota bacterium]